jgi:predicted nucleic acid-binding Zn ribbon protein
VKLGGVLAGAVRDAAPPTLLARVQAAWPAVAGDVIAAEASPASEREGEVRFDCASAVWAQELALMAPDLVGRLNASLRGSEVRALRFSVKAP